MGKLMIIPISNCTCLRPANFSHCPTVAGTFSCPGPGGFKLIIPGRDKTQTLRPLKSTCFPNVLANFCNRRALRNMTLKDQKCSKLLLHVHGSAPHLKFLPSGPSLAVDQQLPEMFIFFLASIVVCTWIVSRMIFISSRWDLWPNTKRMSGRNDLASVGSQPSFSARLSASRPADIFPQYGVVPTVEAPTTSPGVLVQVEPSRISSVAVMCFHLRQIW